MKKILSVIFFAIVFCSNLKAENGYRLWLRYDLITNKNMLENYQSKISSYFCESVTPTMNIACEELENGLKGLLGKELLKSSSEQNGTIVLGAYDNSEIIRNLIPSDQIEKINDEGFIIKSIKHEQKNLILIAGKKDVGVLYGVFYFLRLLQTHQLIENISITSSPKIKLRLLNHWDNLDRTIERGYSGFSIFDWHRLPGYIDQRYFDYARANASIGINGTVVTSVNANALILTSSYLLKVKALADLFRPYGIKIYLTARFSAPIEIGGLKTADPLNQVVQNWWNEKAKEIYSLIPDFGGFLVKANSEGQPGPQDYRRTHLDGANMLAQALKPFGGVVMWRAFVYSNENPEDRAKQAYNEFKPDDGKYSDNVFIQIKNGAIDFQPREPFHPLFGSMPETNLAMEFQITQEYLGQATTLAYLAPMYKECFDSDTYADGKGSAVAQVIDGSIDGHSLTAIAGVSNVGNDINWTGHIFGQSNWYAFGRLAWDHNLTSEEIADEWIRMTFTNDKEFVDVVKDMMMSSREVIVNYMTPLGLHHQMGWDHHYGPGPWIKDKQRADWTSVYYHKADEQGIGFDRTETGSNAIDQYHPEVAKIFSSLELCPEEFLLWFHHVDWNYKTKSGRTLWDEMCYRYYSGTDEVGKMINTWSSLKGSIDDERFNHVLMLLKVQYEEAKWWRDACVLYFQTFSKRPIPEGYEKPQHTLEYYQSLKFPYAPGIKPKWE
ncbi:MAG: alpha-glucuronidase [Ignavibacteriales bacterium]|nr:MAG: alpha-glucuronidase [Ignavibacteriales bacterium]